MGPSNPEGFGCYGCHTQEAGAAPARRAGRGKPGAAARSPAKAGKSLRPTPRSAIARARHP